MGYTLVTGMTPGIVGDDTVHFPSKYLWARREQGRDGVRAVRHAFPRLGVTPVMTTKA